MSAGTPILLERDNVNDDVVILSQWFVKNGERVEEGTLIAEVETSKANVEVLAPGSGYLKWGFEEKADVPYSAPLGHIFAGPIPAEELIVATGSDAVTGSEAASPRLTGPANGATGASTVAVKSSPAEDVTAPVFSDQQGIRNNFPGAPKSLCASMAFQRNCSQL